MFRLLPSTAECEVIHTGFNPMERMNCWEFNECGREAGGVNVPERGECPAATMKEADGFCGGVNGGRACAYITGTFCGGTIQGTMREKEKNCGECAFYAMLKKEHGIDAFLLSFIDFMNRN